MHNRYHNLVHENSGLTAAGWEQADALANWLQVHETVDVVASAPQLHSRLTAQRIGQALGLPVRVLRELPTWRPEWVSPSATEYEPASLREVGSLTSAGVAAPYQEFRTALVDVLDALIGENWGKSVVLVTCPQSVATVLRQVFGSGSLGIQVDHTSLTELKYDGHHWRLVSVNRREHLPTISPVPGASAPAAPRAEGGERDDLSQVIQVYGRVALADRSEWEQKDFQRIRHLLNYAHMPQGARVLDVGTGIGILPIMLAEDGAREAVGVDISPAMLEHAEYLRLSRGSPAMGAVSFRLAPAQALPYCSEYFDAVFCRMVLHHARWPAIILDELHRVLKPDAVLILADLLSADDPVKRATQNAIEAKRNPAHVAARSVDQYRKLVTDAGMTVESTEIVSFERELEEWLRASSADPANGVVVREMMEAGLETDAAGIHVRRQNGKLVFEQRMLYLRAIRP